MFKIIVRTLLQRLFRIEVTGDAGVFHNERTLIVANHESFLDGLLIGLMIPVDAIFVVHSQIASRPFFAFLLRFVPHLAVDSTSPLAMKQIVKLVESGQPVVIFPEGRNGFLRPKGRKARDLLGRRPGAGSREERHTDESESHSHRG